VGHVTISLGLIAVRPDDTAELAFARVDGALYDAKRAGRNCVCTR
jgi:PleD family two-component response regulator